MTPHSRAEITLSGPGLEDPVNIDLNALDDPRDLEAFVYSMKHCRAMV
ncbi:hypothetical protein ACLQ8T_14885 [Glutamicibacter sp. FR1]